jgi:hypothetical protein
MLILILYVTIQIQIYIHFVYCMLQISFQKKLRKKMSILLFFYHHDYSEHINIACLYKFTRLFVQ